jgi:curved DNA-binding protein
VLDKISKWKHSKVFCGVVDLKIPANSQAGKKLRMKGRGIPAKPAGDLYVVLQIALPSADDEKAKDIYQRMRDELDFNPRATMEVA